MNLNKFACASFLLASAVFATEKTGKTEDNVSASTCTFDLELTCPSTNQNAGKAFKDQSDDLLEKIYKVHDCGIEYGKQRNPNSFKNCISNINLSDRYEESIVDSNSYDFRNAIDFKKLIKGSAFRVCCNLKAVYEKKKPTEDVPAVIYLSKKKVTLNFDINESESDVFIWLIIVISILTLALIILGAYLARLKWIKEKSKKTEVDIVDSDEIPDSTEDLFAPPAYENYASRRSTLFE